jgi:heme/copper-type cytochrome/quinol oxidase subunit 1
MTNVERLQQVWETRRVLAYELWSVDHKKIGERYMATAFCFFLLSGIIAMIIRLQLMLPDQTLLSAERFNQLFTIHGTVMIFFFATPMLSGFGNYFVPLLIGARDMAFPRLNAFGYWTFLFSGLFLFSSFVVGTVPDGGWFAYVPLTGGAYSPDVNIDFWAVGLLFLAVSTTAGAINFIVTIFKHRAPGMTFGRMPLFLYSTGTTAFLSVLALPALTVACVFLELDRRWGRTSSRPATAAIRCCGSTCSGSSATRGSTSCSCRRRG